MVRYFRESKCRGCGMVEVRTEVSRSQYNPLTMRRDGFYREWTEEGVQFKLMGFYDLLCKKCSKI